MGDEMPKSKKKAKNETGFIVVNFLMAIAVALLLWLVLKSIGLVDPPEEMTTYILEGILTLMLTANIGESWSFRKKITKQGEAIVEIKTKVEYIEKNIDELKATKK